MEKNGFDSNQYRYFYIAKPLMNINEADFSCSRLKKGDIIKFSERDFTNNLFNFNFCKVEEDIYEYHNMDYPMEEEFTLLKYIEMQKPVQFLRDGVVLFSYQSGDYIIMNEWMENKINEGIRSQRRSSQGDFSTVMEGNQIILDRIKESEEIEDCPLNYIIDELSKIEDEYQGQIYRFKEETVLEFQYHRGETWSLKNPAVFLSLFNQEFINLLVNSKEILGEEKDKIFLDEYKDNVPNSTRKYYQVKENSIVTHIEDITTEMALEHLNVGFNSLVIQKYAATVGTCQYNLENFRSDGSLKYFYVDYKDGFYDAIVEDEIQKIADRLPLTQALEIEKNNMYSIRKKVTAEDYTPKSKEPLSQIYQEKEFSQEFIDDEKRELIKRLLVAISQDDKKKKLIKRFITSINFEIKRKV